MAVLAWFENNDRRKMLCPPQSADGNPIENNSSWMKKDAWEVKLTPCEEIKGALFRSSHKIRPAKIRTVVSSLLRRADAIIRSRAYPTKININCEEREINVDTLVSTLTRQGRHYRDRLVTLRREKQYCFSENLTWEQRGSRSGRMYDWRGGQAL